ncbi:LRRC31 [Branchiostoma lanceolatum]|uniref:LRRC31 protein n=1 Tax=Branchiostoma lanceolatum TaxID=7740 RepID=A0A8J9YMK8_BRALA|nr:LRRC31 [Branchiostoma lanceolatum]
MAEDVNMEVRRAKAIGDLGVKDGESVKTPQAKVEKKPPLLQKEGVKRKRASAQKSPSCEDDLERLYESRKTAVPPPAAVRPKEPPPQPPDVPCRPPDPLYVRRVGQRFWSTKRILDWQRQALCAREDPEAALKPVREYGEAGMRGHYEKDGEHGHYENDGEHGHYETDEEHKYFQYDKNHGHYEKDGEHKYFQYDKNHGHYENDEEHKYFQYNKNHGHYENDSEHVYTYENDSEHVYTYENDSEHVYTYENDSEHVHTYENDSEHVYTYENDSEHVHTYENDDEHVHAYENDDEHVHAYENDGEHVHYENDDEYSNLSTHVYADLDPDFLAAQDRIRNAAFQPFYEMDITPADDEQEQPFYKMDVTAAKDKEKQEQPFYEMKVASADEENEEQIFYDMDDNQLRQPKSDNVYAGLDAEFVAAQDAVCMRDRTGEGSREDGDDPRRSETCREFFMSRLGCALAVCVGVIVVVTAAVVVAVIFNQNSRMRIHPDKSTVPDLTTLPTTSTTLSAHLSVTSPATSTTSSTHLSVTSLFTSKTTDHWAKWTLYIREYFQQDSDAATGLEERYPDNEVVMALLEEPFFWHWVCRYWKYNADDLPQTLSEAVIYGIQLGTSSEYMESHGYATYREFLSSTLGALEALPNTTESLQHSDYRHYSKSLSLSGRTLSDNDVEALAKLFPYLRGVENLHLSHCGLSAEAAKSLAGQLHLPHTLFVLDLSSNKIGDDGLEAIAETFPHLKELWTFNVIDNSITNVGGRALAKRLVHLQELQKIDLGKNELALSLSSLAKAFVNMTRLQTVGLWPITCRADSFRMAAQQVHDAVHTLEGQVRSVGSVLLYDASAGSTGGSWESDAAWQRVEQKLKAGVHISNGKMKMSLKINLLEE